MALTDKRTPMEMCYDGRMKSLNSEKQSPAGTRIKLMAESLVPSLFINLLVVSPILSIVVPITTGTWMFCIAISTLLLASSFAAMRNRTGLGAEAV